MKHGVHDVVRVCEPTYKTDELKKAGISVMDLVFDDGTFPPAEVRLASSLVCLLFRDMVSLLIIFIVNFRLEMVNTSFDLPHCFDCFRLKVLEGIY